MRRSQWIVLTLGSILILVGWVGLLTHSLWSDMIYASLGAFGALISLIQSVLWLSSKETKTSIPTHTINRPPSVTPRVSKISEPFYLRTDSTSSSHYKLRFRLHKPMAIAFIFITLLISVHFIDQIILNSNPPQSLIGAFSWPYSQSTASQSTALNTVAWSPDAKYIAAGGNNGKVEVWDIARKRIICTYSAHKGAILALAWSHDGTRLASGGVDYTVQVWSAENCHQIRTYTGHKGAVNTVAWSPHDIRVASGSDDETVKVWDAVDGVTVNTYSGQHFAISSVAWSPDGNRIASVANSEINQVQVWDATTGSNIVSSNLDSNQVESTVAWSPDDTRIAFNVGSVVQIRDTSSTSIGTIVSINCLGHQDDVNAVAWSPAGIYVASGSKDDTVRVCDSTTGSNKAICRGHSGSVNGLEWASSENRIASVSDDGTIQVCDALSGHNLITLRA